MSTIRAAGAVVWRPAGSGVEIAVVHRPRYDDWSLPKGKLERGESELGAAVREIGEELGAEVQVQRRLVTIAYRTPAGAAKTVAYWAMRRVGGAFEPCAEVDEVAWVSVRAARRLMSYDQDRAVLDSFTEQPVPDGVAVLVRHAHAGRRSEWDGDDSLRPLDRLGQEQARRLVTVLAPFGIDEVLSAGLVRCTQTVVPVADALGLPVLERAEFSDEQCAADPDRTVAAVRAAALGPTVPLISSQGYTIPTVVEALFGPGIESRTRKSAFWVLGFRDGAPSFADYYEDAIRPVPALTG